VSRIFQAAQYKLWVANGIFMPVNGEIFANFKIDILPHYYL